MVKKYLILFSVCFCFVCVMSACNSNVTKTEQNIIEADKLKSDSKEDADYNTKYFQSLMDKASNEKATIKLPAGRFYFGPQETLFDGQETYAIKCRNDVTVSGLGTETVLLPIGEIGPDVSGGIDMFFYNDYRESNFTDGRYLENANFNNFVIDGENTKLSHYNTAGKGFMINLFKNCTFDSLIVRNIDATGIGIDCPVNSVIKDCIADNCGKGATINDEGASGIGIGFGYSPDESIEISGCQCYGCKKFGIFFEWQGRWDSFKEKVYAHKDHKDFKIINCYASRNVYADLGGLYSYNIEYQNCFGDKYYFGPNSNNNKINGKKYDGESTILM